MPADMENQPEENTPPPGTIPIKAVIHLHNRDKTKNPLQQTQRSRVQQKRSAINEQINKEMRLRAGAENLLKVSNNKRLREQVTLELSYVNSNLQLLKEELTDLNTNVQIYQSEEATECLPLIAFGLKETTDVDFTNAFQDIIIDHYYDDPAIYASASTKLMALRRKCRTPPRTSEGLLILFDYYNHLTLVDKRFVIPGRHLGIFFEWYDSFSGAPSIQKSLAFEKGGVLFNIASLYSQIACKQVRKSNDDLSTAIDHFSRAAGVLKQLKDNFLHAPCLDMKWTTLDCLITMLLAQSQECIFERFPYQYKESRIATIDQPDTHRVMSSVNFIFDLAAEASQVAASYGYAWSRIHKLGPMNSPFPSGWLELFCVKRLFYRALSHYYTAVGLLSLRNADDSDVIHILKSHFTRMPQFLQLNRVERIPSYRHQSNLLVINANQTGSINSTNPTLSTFGKADPNRSSLSDTEDAAGKNFKNSKIRIFEAVPKSSPTRHPSSCCAILDNQSTLRSSFYGVNAIEDSSNVEEVSATRDKTSNQNISDIQKLQLGNSQLREAHQFIQECLDMVNVSTYLKTFDGLLSIVMKAYDRIVGKSMEFKGVVTEPDQLFGDPLSSSAREILGIVPRSCQIATHTIPDFKSYKIEDFFAKLGPLSVFNAKLALSTPRWVTIERPDWCMGFGFCVKGSAPVYVSSVEEGSLAEAAGVRMADYIIGVGEFDTKWASHDDVVGMIRNCGSHRRLSLCLVSPAPNFNRATRSGIATNTARTYPTLPDDLTMVYAKPSPGYRAPKTEPSSRKLPLLSHLPNNRRQKLADRPKPAENLKYNDNNNLLPVKATYTEFGGFAAAEREEKMSARTSSGYSTYSGSNISDDISCGDNEEKTESANSTSQPVNHVGVNPVSPMKMASPHKDSINQKGFANLNLKGILFAAISAGYKYDRDNPKPLQQQHEVQPNHRSHPENSANQQPKLRLRQRKSLAKETKTRQSFDSRLYCSESEIDSLSLDSCPSQDSDTELRQFRKSICGVDDLAMLGSKNYYIERFEEHVLTSSQKCSLDERQSKRCDS